MRSQSSVVRTKSVDEGQLITERIAANAAKAEEGEGKRVRIAGRKDRWPTGEAMMREVAHGRGRERGGQVSEDVTIPSMGEAWIRAIYSSGQRDSCGYPRGFGQGRRFLLADAWATIACLPCSEAWKGKDVYGRGRHER